MPGCEHGGADLDATLARFSEHWLPKWIARINDTRCMTASTGRPVGGVEDQLVNVDHAYDDRPYRLARHRRRHQRPEHAIVGLGGLVNQSADPFGGGCHLSPRWKARPATSRYPAAAARLRVTSQTPDVDLRKTRGRPGRRHERSTLVLTGMLAGRHELDHRLTAPPA